MKRSIKHLPKRTQEELNCLLELIPRYVSGCEMIILYGSYARGSHVLWDERIEFGVHTSYQSDLDILVVVSKSNVRIVEQRIRGKVVERYHAAFAHRRHASPQIIVEYIDNLNNSLEEKRYFFTDIVKEGIKMYDTHAFKLTKPRDLSFGEIKRYAEREYNITFPDGVGLLRYAGEALSYDDLRNGSFLLHQVSERFYYAACLVFINYRPKNHKLAELGAMMKGFSRDITTAFPTNTDFEKHCFDLLCRAYIEARYNKDFTVTEEEYTYMLQRVGVLRELTERICTERFAYYDQMIAQEEAAK